jgi:hypothetical protein
MPKRIQRRRTKGWRMPEGAVSVTRPGEWGNPFTVKQCREAGYAVGDSEAAQICVDAFRAWMLGQKHWAHAIPMLEPPDITELRGKDLACFCALDQPCHADVLLELANQ